MAEYKVIWEIDIVANSPKEAAAEAMEIMQDPSSEAVFFTTIEQATGEITELDLREFSEEGEDRD